MGSTEVASQDRNIDCAGTEAGLSGRAALPTGRSRR